ncbi:DUF6285 domain-containing protein [Candidimonas nitroreducens]|uniref:DUF6285 domain-containing protein n=1 Tax=Candidimonas nitroreducens TaxID=683354 RepID=A0A225M3D2_9BURK|nr:DUF6285 domain-containing protein [Candidimonas nitroreducens]OWT55646.1 hypothetical protein CEY11_20160 [Candidimonas nitroreducens]
MLDLPHGPELLDTARRSLLEEILPALPPEQGYTARMIAKAMAIAARELECGADTERDCTRLIAEFLNNAAAAAPDTPVTLDTLDTPDTPDTPDTLDASAAAAARGHADRAQALLAARIRGRAIAPGLEPQLRALLLQLTRAKLAVSNPKYLSQR